MESNDNKKRCGRCKTIKPIIEFYKNKTRNDGVQAYCKPCLGKANNVSRRKNRSTVTEFWRKHYAAHSEEVKWRTQTWKRDNWKKYRAHKLVHRALREGTLSRLECEVCGEAKTDGHHDDYSKPLSVRWLCRYHHRQIH